MTSVTVEMALGARLARRAGWSRMAVVVGCSALGVALLLLCLDYPDVAHNAAGLSNDRIVFTVLTSVVALPVVVLVAATSRLSADTRDRRLSLLRLMGVTPARCALVAAVETGVLVLLGGLGGVLIHALLRVPVWRFALHHGAGRQIAGAHPVRDVAVSAAIALLVSVAAAAPARRGGTTLVMATRRVARARFARSLTVIGLVGMALALGLAVWPNRVDEYGEVTDTRRVPLMGMALVCLAIGLVSITQTVLGFAARRLRHARSGVAVVTAARLEGDRRAIGRSLAGLTLATFASAFGLSVFTVFTTTPQYVDGAWAKTHARVSLVSATQAGLGSSRQEIAQTRGITAVEDAGRFDPADVTGGAPYAVSVSCAQVRRVATVERCSDTQPWAALDERLRGDAGSMTQTYDFGGHAGKRSVTATFASTVSGRWAPGGNGIDWLGNGGTTIVVPPAYLHAHGIAPNAYLVTAAPGAREPLGPGTDFVWSDYDQVEDYRHLTYLLIGVVMSVGLLTVVVTTLDMLAERRRRVAGLRMLGTPVSLLRRSQFAAMLVPLACGVTLATVAGFLMGRGYLNFAGQAGTTPVGALLVLLSGALGAGVILAAATTSGLGRPLSADMLRRE